MGVEIVPAAIGYKDIVSYLCPSSKFPIKGGGKYAGNGKIAYEVKKRIGSLTRLKIGFSFPNRMHIK